MLLNDDQKLKKFHERLKQIRLLRDDQNNLEFRDYCLNKWKDKIPMRADTLQTYSNEDMQEILVAHQGYFRDEILERLNAGAVKGLNKDNLVAFLNTDINKMWNGKGLIRNAMGIQFTMYYIRDLIYQTQVAGKKSNPTDNVDDVKSSHRAYCNCFIFNPGLEYLTPAKLCVVMQLVGGVQTVSSFRPTAASAIYQRYAIDCNPNKKEINILVPSEGFLARLLASYYTAYHNRDKIINYHCIDPNEHLYEPYLEMVEYLKKFGGLFNKVDNWFPHFHRHGSEVDEANFKKHLGIEFDLSFTSPPYGAREIYLSAIELYLVEEGISVGELDEFHRTRKSDKGEFVRIVANEENNKLKVGDKFTHNGKEYKISKMSDSSQSHKMAKTMEGWNELFFRPTIKNCFDQIKSGGYCIWNVANTKAHTMLEADCVRINEEEGFKHTDTLKYIITRRPGSKSKEAFENIFVFQKP